MQAGFKNVFDCIKAFSETDQTDDLRKLTVPTLFIHGDDDQIVRIAAASHAAVKIAPKATQSFRPTTAPSWFCTTWKACRWRRWPALSTSASRPPRPGRTAVACSSATASRYSWAV